MVHVMKSKIIPSKLFEIVSESTGRQSGQEKSFNLTDFENIIVFSALSKR